MIPVPVVLPTFFLLMAACAAVCLAFWFRVDSLKEQNAALSQTLKNMARMEKLNADAFYALMRELNKAAQNGPQR